MALDDRLEPVTVEGDRVLAFREDLDDLRAAPPSTAATGRPAFGPADLEPP